MEKQVEVLEERVKCCEDKLNELETKSAVSDEKFNNMMNMIREVKKSVELIAKTMQENQKRPLNMIYQVAGGLILLGLGVAIGWR